MSAPPRSLKQLFVPPPAEKCTRCSNRVYQVEKIGPVNEVIFHKQCFKCCICGQHLSLKSYFTNHGDYSDKEIYCSKDCPKFAASGYDASAMGIRSALSVPKGVQQNQQLRGIGDAPKIGSDAMYIRGALSAQRAYQRKNITKYDKHMFPAYLVNKSKDVLSKYQKELEIKQREEEDRLMLEYQKDSKVEMQNMEEEFNEEWETQLQEVAKQYDKKEKKMTVERFEQEKAELRKTLTVKMMKRKEVMSMKLQKQAQQQTSTMVKKHSQEMLALLKSKQEELQRELEIEIKTQAGAEFENNPEILEEALAALALPEERTDPHPPRIRKRDFYVDASVFAELDEDVFKVAESEQITFTDLVRQLTEHCLSDLQKARAIFRWITVKDLNVMEFDESINNDSPLGLLKGIKSGTETYQALFTRLCSYAGLPCEEIWGHSKSVGYEPGMKIREDSFLNSWNVVLVMGDWWPVQCNWGARHLVLNKDQHDKTQQQDKNTDKIRYQYDEHYFLTDPDEFIQEFWAKDKEWQLLEKPITLEEFESYPFVRSVFFHYGLEFSEHMKAVINTDAKGGADLRINIPEDLAEDLVFHYQLRFADRERRNDIEYRNIKIERFVFHSQCDNSALFSVHVPCAASYYLEIFAYKINDSHKISNDPNATMSPFRLKCATKFKIVCDELADKMHPLPNCATGEWGPNKAKRHFGMLAITHSSGVHNIESEIEIKFKIPRPLSFLCRLRLNYVDDSTLEKYILYSVKDLILIIKIYPPKPGQYGLDIYAKPEDTVTTHAFAHACKYVLNCNHVNNLIEINSNEKIKSNGNALPNNKIIPIKKSPQKFGPTSSFDEFGLKAISHKDYTIDKVDKSGSIVIEIGCTNSSIMLVAQLFHDPDEEWNNRISVKEGSKKYKFTLSLPKEGTYTFTIKAGKKDEPVNSASVAYIYQIIYISDETLKKKKNSIK